MSLTHEVVKVDSIDAPATVAVGPYRASEASAECVRRNKEGGGFWMWARLGEVPRAEGCKEILVPRCVVCMALLRHEDNYCSQCGERVELAFEEWKRRVDRELLALVEVTSEFLPDTHYFGMYEQRMTPKDAAAYAVENAKD